MRARNGFILRHVAGEWILMPAGDRIRTFHGTLVMNELSAFVWGKLQGGAARAELLASVLEEYEIDEDTAARDLDKLLEDLAAAGVIEE